MIELTMADEIPLPEIPDIHWWSENFCFDGFDPVTNIAFWIHIGRWSKDTRLWREQVLLYLPDGSFLIHRGYGTGGPRENGVAGPGLEVTVPAPGQTLRLRYTGPARPTTSEELSDLPLREKAAELVVFDLTFQGSGEIWEWGAILKHQTGSSFHIEQPGRFSGDVRYGDTTVEVDAYGHRDHSHGPRDIAPMVSSHWGQGHFPNGRSFALCQSRSRDAEGTVAPKIDLAVIWQDGKRYPATASAVPYVGSPFDPLSTSYHLTIESELDTMEIDATIWTHLLATTDRRFECYDGLNPLLGVRALIEAPTRYTWNGKQGAGWSERGSSFATPR